MSRLQLDCGTGTARDPQVFLSVCVCVCLLENPLYYPRDWTLSGYKVNMVEKVPLISTLPPNKKTLYLNCFKWVWFHHAWIFLAQAVDPGITSTQFLSFLTSLESLSIISHLSPVLIFHLHFKYREYIVM